MIWLGKFHGSGIQGSKVCERTPFGVNVQVRVTLVNFLIIVSADLPTDISRNAGISELGNEGVSQTMKTKCAELPAFAFLFNSAIRVNTRDLHHALKLRR